MKCFSCNDLFRDGEDFRDHLPCPGKRFDANLELISARLKITRLRNCLASLSMQLAKKGDTALSTYIDAQLQAIK